MKILTWLTSSGDTYVSNTPLNSCDIAIPSKPAPPYPDTVVFYNRDTGMWDYRYDTPPTNDITLGEIDRLHQAAVDGDVIASVLLKMIDV